MSRPRILVVHAWMKGNLGDVLQLSVLLSRLREVNPRTLDLAGYPAQPAEETAEVTGLADRYIPDAFPWCWAIVPAGVGTAVFQPWWTRRRKALFSNYDALVCAPGPYLADYDPRAISALSDIRTATTLGIPVVLSSHSVGPLDEQGIAVISKATMRIARELATHHYLGERGVPSVLSADLAFLYPYERVNAAAPFPAPYRVLFLRSNNLDARTLRITDGTLVEGSRVIAQTGSDRVVLATSDRRRDSRFLTRAARTLGVQWMPCASVTDLVRLIAGSSGVISDRYHPAICAAVLGKPVQVLRNREPHKMEGLGRLLAGSTVQQLQRLARTGLDTVVAALRNAA